MQEIKRIIVESYFTIILLLIAQILTFFISVRNRNKFNELKHFHLYPAAALLQSVLTFSSMVFLKRFAQRIVFPSVSLFMLFEFFIIYYFSFRILQLKIAKILLKLLFSFYLVYIIYMWLFSNGFLKYYEVYFVQSVILLVPSILYFFQLFKMPAQNSPENLPSFWINVGILFFFC